MAAAYWLASLYGVAHWAGVTWGGPFARPVDGHRAPAPGTAVVLLGSGAVTAPDATGRLVSAPDRISLLRVAEAARIYHETQADLLISSGGPMSSAAGAPSVGAVMSDTLRGLGVPREGIVVDSLSRSTHEQAVVVSNLLAGTAVSHVLLVTSPTHMPRALAAFRSQGVAAVAAPSAEPVRLTPGWRWWLPSATGLDETGIVLHERLGSGLYASRGWS